MADKGVPTPYLRWKKIPLKECVLQQKWEIKTLDFGPTDSCGTCDIYRGTREEWRDVPIVVEG